MSGKKDRKTNDHLNDDDRIVWKQVSDTAEPLKRRPDLPKRPKTIKKSGLVQHQQLALSQKTLAPPSSTPSYTPQRQNSPAAAPALGVDRAMKRKLGRGQVEIDARLDLHGKTQAAAHQILRSFLLNAQARRYRTVLIITGKGDQGIARHTLHSFDVIHTPERTGILMRCVPQWLSEPDLRDLVIGYQPAHPRHGGGGALYVRLRQKKVR